MKAPNGRRFAVVVLQFRFPNLNSVPMFVRQMLRKHTPSDAAGASGEMLVDPTEGTSLVQLLVDLEAVGYSLVNTICEERNNVGGRGVHYSARFVFATPSSRMKPTPAFERRQATLRRELQTICEDALWKARIFSNPFIRDGKPVTNTFGANIVLDTRQPFYQGDGQPVTTWLKDGAGERIGDAPIPLTPSFHLRAPKNRGFAFANP